MSNNEADIAAWRAVHDGYTVALERPGLSENTRSRLMRLRGLASSLGRVGPDHVAVAPVPMQDSGNVVSLIGRLR